MFADLELRTLALFEQLRLNPDTINITRLNVIFSTYEEAKNDLNLILKIPAIEDHKVYARLLPVYLSVNQLDEMCKDTKFHE